MDASSSHRVEYPEDHNLQREREEKTLVETLEGGREGGREVGRGRARKRLEFHSLHRMVLFHPLRTKHSPLPVILFKCNRHLSD